MGERWPRAVNCGLATAGLVLLWTAFASERPPLAAERERLDGAALRADLVGRPLDVLTDADQPGTLVYRADGRAEIALPGTGVSETGRWRIAGDLLCHRFPRLLGAEERCFVVERVAADKFVTSDDYLLWY